MAEADLALAQKMLGRAEQALAARLIKKALKLFDDAERCGCDPDVAAAGRWTCHMLLGNYARAWRESDVIAKRGRPDVNRFWDGKPLDRKRVLIRCLHGLGDTIQFIRYAPLIRHIARSLTIEAQPALKALLRQSQLADEVMTWGEPEPEWDQQIEVMELPRIFRPTIEDLPRNIPYISTASKTSALLCRQPDAIEVGVVWTSSTFNPARSVPITEFAAIFDVPGVRFYSLQCGVERGQFEPWARRVRDLQDELITVEETARIMQNLDLVITVDSMTAHLAGALGMPVWTLIPFEGDWRWMLEREDSPWYPTMRLFRQSVVGDWRPIVLRVRSELDELAKCKRRTVKNGHAARSHLQPGL